MSRLPRPTCPTAGRPCVVESTSRRIQNGFTLIEVLVAIAILAAMGAMTFGSFQQAFRQKEEIEAADDRYAQVRLALDRIASDLAAAFVSDHYDRHRFRERPTLFRGEDKSHEDELLLTALVHTPLEPDAKEGDAAVIKYFLDRDPSDRRRQALFRREYPVIDEDLERRGRKSVLCEGVSKFDLQYWDASKNEWVDEWDTARPEHNGVLPERVKFTLTYVDERGEERTLGSQQRIMLLRSLNF